MQMKFTISWSTSEMARSIGARMSSAPLNETQLRLLSVVIPARNEEACIASTVEHLYLELRRHNVPHEIIVVDDSSTDATGRTLESLRHKFPA